MIDDPRAFEIGSIYNLITIFLSSTCLIPKSPPSNFQIRVYPSHLPVIQFQGPTSLLSLAFNLPFDPQGLLLDSSYITQINHCPGLSTAKIREPHYINTSYLSSNLGSV